MNLIASVIFTLQFGHPVVVPSPCCPAMTWVAVRVVPMVMVVAAQPGPVTSDGPRKRGMPLPTGIPEPETKRI